MFLAHCFGLFTFYPIGAAVVAAAAEGPNMITLEGST